MDEQRLNVLVVEENQSCADAIREAMNRLSFSNDSFFAQDTPEAIQYLEKRTSTATSPLPDLIMLHLAPDKVDSWNFLSTVKQDSAWSTVPVLALSDTEDRLFIHKAYQAGVTSFLAHPHNTEEWLPLLESLRSYWGSVVRLPKKNVRWLTGNH
ncbi:response regulator [Tellurirhabdus rosea]|uniref:response regulator n=1 Tax=Tellurirhabdus rosea TaxID=2674997 RepID=UPI0022518FBD|nr:response regulator [Tellurirhabdus rosea]